jgi:AMMECR1 domain-containing protein
VGRELRIDGDAAMYVLEMQVSSSSNRMGARPIVSIEFVVTPDRDLRGGIGLAPFAMLPDAARELAAALCRAAVSAERGQAGEAN